MQRPDLSGRPETTTSLVRLRDLRKTFSTLDSVITAADGVDLDIEAGTVTALTGHSGSGKSTLLHLIGALDRPDSGLIIVDGTDITHLQSRRLAAYRRSIGFVFQRFHLLPTLDVIDNVLAPLIPQGVSNRDLDRARDLLDRVGLGGRERTIATRLSGGQQQRVAVARALITQPRILLADEPTGNLDSVTAAEIEELLFDLRREHQTTLVIATHDLELAARCDSIVTLVDGRVVG